MKKGACFLFLLLGLSLMASIPYVQATPDYEDFTTYMEIDPNNHINVTENYIDHLANDNESAYVYKDRGIDHFGNFTHYIEFKSGFDSANTECFVWMLSNDVDDVQGLEDKSEISIGIGLFKIFTYCIITLYEYNTARYTDTWLNGLANTWYYLTIQKSGISLTCKIYSNSARTVLVNTLNLVLHGDYKFRYIFGCNTRNVGTGYIMNNDIANFDLDEIRTLTFYNNTGGIFRVDNATITNGTSKSYVIGTVIEFIGIPQNSTIVFSMFEWDNSNSTINPYNFTVSSNMTVWCIFEDAPKSRFAVGLLFGAIIGLVIGLVIALGASKR